MSTKVDEQAILQSLRSVPEDRWHEVLRFVESMNDDSPIRTAADLVGSDVVGLWADRDDLTNSVESVQGFRPRAEPRPATTDAPRQ